MADKPAPAKKFSLFKKAPFAAPKWPAPGKDEGNDEEEDFFSRSSHTYALLAADEAERKKRRREEETQKQVSAQSSPSSRKKRRSSVDAGALTIGESSQAANEPDSSGSKSRDVSPNKSPSLLEDTGYVQNISTEAGSSKAQVVEIESDDDDVFVTSFRAQESGPASQADPLLPATQPTQESPKHAPSGDGDGTDALLEDDDLLELSEPPVASSADHSSISEASTQVVQQPPANEPKVSVLITSSISGTTPLIVQRKLGQRLKEARLEWCNRQQFAPEQTAQIVLTWRGKRVYDSTSCRALGIGTDPLGNIVDEGEKDLFGIEERRIHMEAMTEEMLAKAKQAKLNPMMARAEAAAEAAAAQELSSQKEKSTRVILKSVGFEELRFIVKPTFQVSRLIKEFRERHKVEETRSISIHFDGEALEPESTIADTEIEDMDTLDVYVK